MDKGERVREKAVEAFHARGSKTISALAKDLGVKESTLRDWVKKAKSAKEPKRVEIEADLKSRVIAACASRGSRTIRDIAVEYGVSYWTLSNWLYKDKGGKRLARRSAKKSASAPKVDDRQLPLPFMEESDRNQKKLEAEIELVKAQVESLFHAFSVFVKRERP